MKHTLTSIAILLALSAGAQNVTKDAQGNYHAIHKAQAAPHDSTTASTYTDHEGQVLPVYKGRKGGLYVLYPDPLKGTRRHYLKTAAPAKK